MGETRQRNYVFRLPTIEQWRMMMGAARHASRSRPAVRTRFRSLAVMADTPWLGDAVSLVDAFRRGERSPVEELDATLAAIERSDLNAFSFLDPDGGARSRRERRRARSRSAACPIGVKELDNVAGWPATEASLPCATRSRPRTPPRSHRLRAAGAVPVRAHHRVASSAASTSRTRSSTARRGTRGIARTRRADRRADRPRRSPAGSCTLATGGDGGGSIRIPAGFTGLPGLKATYGRIPKGPNMIIGVAHRGRAAA